MHLLLLFFILSTSLSLELAEWCGQWTRFVLPLMSLAIYVRLITVGGWKDRVRASFPFYHCRFCQTAKKNNHDDSTSSDLESGRRESQ